MRGRGHGRDTARAARRPGPARHARGRIRPHLAQPATERAYRSDWADFTGRCELAGLIALPAEPTTIGAYLSDRADSLKVATLNRRIAAITAAHRMAGQGLDGGH